MATRIFIDGAAGTTGLEILDRLEGRAEFDLILLDDERRKSIEAVMAAKAAVPSSTRKNGVSPFHSVLTWAAVPVTLSIRTNPPGIPCPARGKWYTARPSRTASSAGHPRDPQTVIGFQHITRRPEQMRKAASAAEGFAGSASAGTAFGGEGCHQVGGVAAGGSTSGRGSHAGVRPWSFAR